MTNHKPTSVIYKDQPVEIGLLRHGDKSSVLCTTNKLCTSSFHMTDYYTYSELCFDATQSVNITCTAAFDEEGDAFEIKKTLYLEVKGNYSKLKLIS